MKSQGYDEKKSRMQCNRVRLSAHLRGLIWDTASGASSWVQHMNNRKCIW
uniref:Uncharacterized protein n=1 Tax=Nelumbo nucifera TaxID=4432 RepID=A0A822ZTY9_NELNU|nr:TPA_asm: hypothetical protein HUJ06_018284 [Nelumbo nucifera]